MNDLQQHFNHQLESCPDTIKRWVIGLSGGLDSVVLLHLAARAIPAEQLLVVTVDHQLQAQSSQWTDFCRQLAVSLHLPFYHEQVVVPEGASVERAARDARYRVFEKILQPDDCLLLAHHLNDQAETMLFRLLRGAGVRGLAGIPPRRTFGKASLFRPLLDIARPQLQQWAQAEQLAWVEDPSNRDLSFDRNYLRHKVIPVLEARWPRFARRWASTARFMRESEQLHQDLAIIDSESVALGDGLDCSALAQLSPARQNNLLRFWCRAADVVLSERQLLAIKQLIGAADDRQPVVQLGHLQLRRYQGVLLLQTDDTELEWGDRPLIASLELPQGRLVVSESAVRGLKSLAGVTLRNRRDGDRCRPLGRGGSCSLKKLFQESGIPAWQRRSWPVCVVGDEIVALPGICVCENWQSEKKGSGFALKWQPTALSVKGDSDTL
ncbi:tRNA lysidine(34) synthetase TilS [Amphritea opalescens]|uniref:tRNA(Ile)-lysidine synthase n=1 Tax=Amphritea opalescens TaxID=2490544 RepID=A0A430KTT1_9GAMM|nr:tRNA lysidine(34) synthetase TilS [Amphritea opalescens]RTE66912.1 tRNA lysidine(34) synthetase TilS [Amphritea opalescens]